MSCTREIDLHLHNNIYLTQSNISHIVPWQQHNVEYIALVAPLTHPCNMIQFGLLRVWSSEIWICEDPLYPGTYDTIRELLVISAALMYFYLGCIRKFVTGFSKINLIVDSG